MGTRRDFRRAPGGGEHGGEPVSADDAVLANLPLDFFDRMKRKVSRKVANEYRWALDRDCEYRALRDKWVGGDKGAWTRLEELLESAPGMGGVTLLRSMSTNQKDMLAKMATVLSKDEEEEEFEKRERDLVSRFDLMDRLVEAGAPVPGWFDQDWKIVRDDD